MNNANPSAAAGPRPFIWWTIWTALFVTLFIYQHFLGAGFIFGPDPAGPLPAFPVVSCVILFLVSSIARWLILPRVKHLFFRFHVFIVGLAMAECIVLFEIFLVDPEFAATRMTLFLLGVVAVAQFIPLFVGRESDTGRTSVRNAFKTQQWR